MLMCPKHRTNFRVITCLTCDRVCDTFKQWYSDPKNKQEYDNLVKEYSQRDKYKLKGVLMAKKTGLKNPAILIDMKNKKVLAIDEKEEIDRRMSKALKEDPDSATNIAKFRSYKTYHTYQLKIERKSEKVKKNLLSDGVKKYKKISDDEWECLECGKTLKTKTGIKSHISKKH